MFHPSTTLFKLVSSTEIPIKYRLSDLDKVVKEKGLRLWRAKYLGKDEGRAHLSTAEEIDQAGVTA